MEECLKGNEEAWAALIDKYKNLIFSIPIKYGFSNDDAADIFQGVCMGLLSELPQLRRPRALSAWLIQMTSHKCFHWKKEQERYLPIEEQKLAAREPRRIPEEFVHQLEREQILREALFELSPRCQQLIGMLFFQTPARPYAEVARSLGLATGSVGFIRMGCLQRLRRLLRRRGLR